MQFLIPWFLLTLLAQCSVTLAADFDKCLEVVKALPIDCSDPNFFCPKGEKPQGNETFITRRGCLSFCGNGIDLDPLDDIIIRFILWLLPVIILAAHFHFPALGWTNTLAVCWGILGNPIGSLYAMLTRVEKGRSGCWQAVAVGFTNKRPEEVDSISHLAARPLQADTAADVAAICLACDEFGWHDPLDELVQDLTIPSDPSSPEACAPAGEVTRNDRDKSANAEKGTNEKPLPNLKLKQVLYLAECRHDLISHRNDSQAGTTFAIIGLIGAVCSGFIKTWMDRHKTWSSRTIPMVILSYHFIALVQISGIVGAFTSVFGPMLALQQLQKRLKVLGDSTKQDGTIGNSKGHMHGSEKERLPMKKEEEQEEEGKKEAETAKTKEEVNISAKEISPQKHRWLLCLELEPDIIWSKMKGECQIPTSLRRSPTSAQEEGKHGDGGGNNESQSPLSEERSALSLSRPWLDTARYLGMNPTWRPHKPEKARNPPNHKLLPAWKPFVLAFLFVTTSWLSAFLHSYLYVPRPGFGCRTLTWTMIYSAWLISLVLDFAFKSPRLFHIRSYEILWRRTWIKDMVISLMIIITIITTHLGLQATCYCKSGTIVGDKHINLNPPESVAMWVEMGTTAFGGLAVTLFLIYVAGYFGDNARSVLCPGRDERNVIQLRLERLRKQVEEEDKIKEVE